MLLEMDKVKILFEYYIRKNMHRRKQNEGNLKMH